MDLTFPSHRSFELSFKVGIAGTQALPQSVSVVLERDGKALSFKATKVVDDWVANITNPGEIFQGSMPVGVSVNVIVNNRLFVPLKTTAVIEDSQVQQEFMPAVEAVEDKAEVVVPTPVLKTSNFADLITSIAKSTNEAVKPIELVPFSITPMKSKLKEQLKKSVKKPKIVAEKIVTEQITVKSTPVKVSLFKDIDTSFIVNHKETKPKEPIKQQVKESVALFKLKRINTLYK